VKLQFRVNQAEALRKGIDAPESIVTVQVNPAELSAEQRTLLADRLYGIDVCRLSNSEQGTVKQLDMVGRPILIEATEPTFEGLMEAVHLNQAEVEKSQAHHRGLAIAAASAAVSQAAALEDLRNRMQGNTTLSW